MVFAMLMGQAEGKSLNPAVIGGMLCIAAVLLVWFLWMAVKPRMDAQGNLEPPLPLIGEELLRIDTDVWIYAETAYMGEEGLPVCTGAMIRTYNRAAEPRGIAFFYFGDNEDEGHLLVWTAPNGLAEHDVAQKMATSACYKVLSYVVRGRKDKTR